MREQHRTFHFYYKNILQAKRKKKIQKKKSLYKQSHCSQSTPKEPRPSSLLHFYCCRSQQRVRLHTVAHVGGTWKTFVPMGGLGGACLAPQDRAGMGGGGSI